MNGYALKKKTDTETETETETVQEEIAIKKDASVRF